MPLLRRSRSSPPVVALVAGAIVLAGCGAADADDGAPVAVPEDASAPVPPAGADEGPPDAAVFAAVFASASPIDAEFDATSLAGEDSVLWFWAPWCASCRAEAPDVIETIARFDDDVQVVGVAGRGDLHDMRDFIGDTGTSGFTHVADLDGGVWNAFGIFAQPAFAFIDDTGEIETFIGGLPADDLADRIERLLAS